MPIKPNVQANLMQQALAHYDAGDYPQARTACDTLLQLLPQDYAALHLAGLIASAQKRLPEAAKFLQQSISQAPDAQTAAACWCALGKALRAAGDLRQAEEALRRAFSTDPRTCSYAIELADIYAEGWKLNLAVETLKTAANRFFNDPVPCAALGNLLNKYSRQPDAVTAYELAIKRKPDYAQAHLALGSTLMMLGKFAEAETALREALRLDPMIKAYYQLAQVRKFKLDAGDIEAIQQRLDPQMNATKDARIDALFALSKIYDNSKDYRSAFHSLEEASRLHRSTVKFSNAEYEAMAERIIALFTPEFLARYAGKSASDLAPIFILGMFRSGTTLTEQILASHSRVRGGGELLCMVHIAKQLGETWENRGDAALSDDAAVIHDLTQAAARYREMSAHVAGNAPRFTDKLPTNFFYVGIIHLLFPKASIIYCHRNPVATCFSCFQNNILMPANGSFSHDLTDLGHFYKLHERMMAHWRKALPGRILQVEYEDMVEDPEAGIRRLLDFCGLEFEQQCLDFHSLKRPVATASVMQVRKPLYKGAIDHWKNYAPFLGPLFDALQTDTPASASV
ncbi:MAG: tetratricopeptide repeat-containing sulfotransferase family protein [Gammaproteobacteria bacterium]